MTKGGYQILDLKNESFTIGTGKTVTGAYETVEGTRKAILVSGVDIGGTEYHDTFVDFTVSNSNYVGTIYGKTITITSADLITISNPTA